jgi:transcriptional regulator with XRE-family HTH domain/DNA-directed RNA polymerase subunit RPC12/RpoP
VLFHWRSWYYLSGGAEMDQIKTGKFIARIRKEHSLTQKQLGDILNISDKTVSKWECGKGFPEISLIQPLCNVLEISINELFSAEKISDAEFKTKAEDNIMKAIEKEVQENKKKVVISIIMMVITLIAAITIFMVVEFVEISKLLEIVLIVIGLVVLFGGLFAAALLEMSAGTYECPHCKARFVPTTKSYIMGMHTITLRHLKCPECGKKSWCKRRLSK